MDANRLSAMVSRVFSCSELGEGFAHLQKDLEDFKKQIADLEGDDALALDMQQLQDFQGLLNQSQSETHLLS